jgi:transposase-like protein
MIFSEPKCPKCGSTNTKDVSKHNEKERTITCKNCQHTWVEPKKDSFF